MSLDSMLGWNSRRLSAPPSSVGNGASNTISARRHPTRASIGSPQSVSKWARRSSFNYESRKSEGSERTELKRLLSEFGSVQPLSQVEICIVKDVWNKWLAWKSMHTEFVVERLFYLHPELLKCLGPAAALMPELFPAIMDLCVRDLQPHTENVARESYGPIHPAIGTAKTAFASKVDYFTLFAEMKISCAHWEELRGLFLDSVLASPYMEAYELDDCNTGPSSAIWRFFTLHVMAPAYERAEALSALMVAPGSSTLLVNSWVVVGRSNDALQNLMKGCVELSPHVDVGKVRQLALRLLSGLDTAVNWFPQWNVLLPLLHRFEDTHVTLDVVGDREPGQFSRDLAEVFMGLVARCSESVTEVWRHVLHRVFLVLIVLPATAHQRLQKDAFEWLQLMSTEFGWSDEKLGERKAQVLSELLENGTYTHTQEELVHGARVAWRNSAKCIGRITWKALHVRDMRHINDPDAMFNQILEHHKVATDGESIAAVATVFRARHSQERFGPRFWSPQFVRFACHEMEDGSLLGDKANLQLTRAALSLGWRPPATKTEFDALPFIIEHPSGGPRMYNVPAEEARYIAIEHPHYPAVKELNLKWCSVPTISNFGLRLGGLDYSLVFNGWFMCTEIARDVRCAS
jgi:nitric oxide synthase oxygenase domain/subunit